jgi:hypothetical protein
MVEDSLIHNFRKGRGMKNPMAGFQQADEEQWAEVLRLLARGRGLGGKSRDLGDASRHRAAVVGTEPASGAESGKNRSRGRQPPADHETRKIAILGAQSDFADHSGAPTRKNATLGAQNDPPEPSPDPIRKNETLGAQSDFADHSGEPTWKNATLGAQDDSAGPSPDPIRKNDVLGAQSDFADHSGAPTRKNAALGAQNDFASRPEEPTWKDAALGAQSDPAGPSPDPIGKTEALGAQKQQRILARIDEHAESLRTQGSVVETWRTYQGQRFGPYYRMKFRHQGRQRSIYLGTSAELAEAVRQKLAKLQLPYRQSLDRRREWKVFHAALRRQKAILAEHAAAAGIHLKGWEFRGIRNLERYYESGR